MRLFGQLHYATMVLYLRRNLTCPVTKKTKEQFCLAISSRAVLKSTFPNTRDFCENGNKRWDTHIIIIFLTFVRRIFLHFLITRAQNKDIVCAFFTCFRQLNKKTTKLRGNFNNFRNNKYKSSSESELTAYHSGSTRPVPAALSSRILHTTVLVWISCPLAPCAKIQIT